MINLEDFVGKLTQEQTQQLLRICLRNIPDEDRLQEILEEEIEAEDREAWAESWFNIDRDA